MYFINEKAGAMSTKSTNGMPVSFEKGLPALYRVQGTIPDRKIIIWRDANRNIHIETTYNNIEKIIEAIKKFENGEKYY